MGKQELFDDIVDGQFPKSRWASLGLAAEFPLIPEDSRLAQYITGLVIGYNTKRDNKAKYDDEIARGLPADTSLLTSIVSANRRFSVVDEVYGDIAFDVKDPEIGGDVSFESIVARACYYRHHRTEGMVSISETEAAKLNTINARLRDLFLEEQTAEHFSEMLTARIS